LIAKQEYEPDVALKMFNNGTVHSHMYVSGSLDLSNKGIEKLPDRLSCYELNLSDNPLKSIPDDLEVECTLTLNGCRNLNSLPEGFQTGSLELQNCTELESLPEDLDVWYLDAGGCSRLKSFPKRATIEHGSLSIAGCNWISSIPEYVGRLATFDISDCPLITELPEHLEIGLWIDVAGSGLSKLPAHLKESNLRWRGVPVDERIAFHPETIKASDALTETNAEIRRVLIERMGFEKFFDEANGHKLDKDTDPGGARELIRIDLENDEDIVCLSCFCPSTKRHYLLRVPPTILTCHEAAAWMAGFNDASKYQPVIET
jgi:hypothetical protein